MKKRISILTAALLIINLFTVFNIAGAEGSISLGSGYEFMDTAYSESLGIYLAAAKKMDASTNGQPLPVEIYKSTDRLNWTKTFSRSSAYMSANKKTRQSLIWWEDAGLFVLSTGDNIFTSPDGEAWSAKKIDNSNQGILRGNAMIASSADRLIVSGGRAVKFANPDTVDNKQVDHHIFDINNTSTTTIAVGASEPDEDGNITYVSVSSGKFWFYAEEYDEGTNGNIKNVETVNNSFTSDKFAYDMIYDPNTRSWLIVNGTDRLYVLGENKDYTNFAINSESSITAVGTDGVTALAGTADGTMYYTDASGGVNAGSEWLPVEKGTGTMTDEVRSITPVDNNEFMVVTASKIYIVKKDASDEKMKFYDITWSGITMTAGKERIEVPAEGNEEYEFSFVSTDYMGNVLEGEIKSIDLLSAPEHVTFNEGILTVSSECPGGEASIRIETTGGAVEKRIIVIAAEKEVVIEGADGIVIPSDGTETKTFTAYVTATDGEPMEREIVFTGVLVPEGVTFDEDTGTLTVSSDASAG